MKVKISKGNSKMGKVWNISLPPVKACLDGIPCADGCYALKSYRMYKNVKLAWEHNLDILNNNPIGYFDSIREQLESAKNPPKFFRWHVAGDIQNDEYLCGMVETANKFPHIKFLAFTKNYQVVIDRKQYIPKNLQIILSAWPNVGIPLDHSFNIAYMQDGTENRVNGSEIECTGTCETCGMCFDLKKTGLNVVFNKH